MLKSTRDTARVLVVLALSATCTAAATSPNAWAGQYHVYSCRTPTEQAAPADGWTPSTSMTSATVIAKDTCGSGGALMAALGDGSRHEVGTSATWTFAVPVGESVKQMTLWRAGDTEGGSAQNATYQFGMAGPTRPEVFSECLYSLNCKTVGETAQPLSLVNILAVPSRNLGAHLYVNASCGGLPGYLCPEGKNDPNGYAAVVYLYAADILLEETAQPTITPGSVGGELATATTVSGTASVTFQAEDSGSGVYQAVMSVDEKVLGSAALDSNGGRCADIGHTSDGLHAFLYLQPCAPVVSADVPLDTTKLSNGSHHLVVTVTDAAGNSTVVLDRKLEVANGSSESPSSKPPSALAPVPPALGPPNGSPASAQAVLSAHWRSNGRATLAGRWGRAQTIVGQLTTATGMPIASAAVEASATPSSQGAVASALAASKTDSEGRFSVRLSSRAGSETIVVAYRAHLGDALPAAQRSLTLTVPASLALRVSPRVSHVGGTIRFAGLLHGGPIPRGGKQLALQARAPHSQWRTFQLLSTDAHGRYRASYRFRLPGPIVYQFRVVSPHEADFPFAAGSSNVVRVRER